MPHKWAIYSPSLVSFFLVYMVSFIVVMGYNDWMMIWMGLEINMISFIMLIYSKYNCDNIESCLSYFFVQALGSVVFFLMFYMEINIFKTLGGTVLCYKMGGGPFFFWFPSVCEGISWWSCYFLMTFQKVIPLMLISMMISKILWVYAFFSLVVGAIGCMNESMVKKLMAFSSIHHIGWLLISVMVKGLLWGFYLLVYLIMMSLVIEFLSKMDVIMVMSLVGSEGSYALLAGLLSIGGVPPFLGFFLKWWSLYYIMMYDFSLLMAMIALSVVMLYIYFRLIYDLVMGGSQKVSWLISNEKGNSSKVLVLTTMFGFVLGSFVSLAVL